MLLYLVRHGKARPRQDDPDQHLTDTGLQEVQRVAEFIKPLDLKVRAIWHSPKARAVQTAQALSLVVDADQGLIRRDGLAPNDAISPVRKEIESAPADLMIVGHLPFLSKLASLLLAYDESAGLVSFRNAGLICLESVSDGEWKLAWMITPQLL